MNFDDAVTGDNLDGGDDNFDAADDDNGSKIFKKIK